MTAEPPVLQDVLANVRRGRVAYLVLNREQKRALRDPERFPLAEQAFQAVALRLGYVVGQKRCRRMVKRLRVAGVVGRCGHYRQPYRNSGTRSGFRVILYKLGHRLLGARRSTKRKRPVGKRTSVKANFHVPWWRHPLFGDLLGLPPPEISRHDLRRMKTLDERFESPR